MDGQKQTSTIIHINLVCKFFELEICHVTVRKLKLQIFISLHSISIVANDFHIKIFVILRETIVYFFCELRYPWSYMHAHE